MTQYYFKYCIAITLFLSFDTLSQVNYTHYHAVQPFAMNIIFNEEFENNDHKWEIVQHDEDIFRHSNLKDGNYHLSSKEKNETVIELKSGFQYTTLDNFEIETKIKHVANNKSHANGIIWGMSPNGKKGYSFVFSGDGRFHIQKLNDGHEVEIVKWQYHKSIKKYDYNKLTVRKIDHSYYLFINEHFVKRFPYSKLTSKDDVTGFVAEGTSINIENITIKHINTVILDNHAKEQLLVNANKTLSSPVFASRGLVVDKKEVNKPFEETVGNFYALIISVQNYDDKDIQDLKYPHRDAKNFRSILEEKYGFATSNIIQLNDPKRDDVVKAFNSMRNQINENDNLIIYYAGHGIYDEEVAEGYWLPSDAHKSDDSHWIANSNLSTKLKGIKAKHTLLISDACFSGSIFRSSRSILNEPSQSITNYYSKKSRKGMTSGTLKTVPDQSVFSKYLFQTLNTNQDKFMTASSLFYRFNKIVANNSQNAPQFGVLYGVGDEGGEFVFINKQKK
ncbi:caspase family protein [Flammeovirga yaeyamensis]|uniref:Caspase family protein n=1 Tax=Flammeovirga yaeyamensis TaxID=367791 RepID=A0AAX1N1T5_9BACT|nr:caspase family protein [Flammeovirga yaeyamensis]MBB3696179.1 hypothetical protein [Flammeovirga yaeyamensis]NMF34862.1 caspase family protein [Flammeovirga yaeyamensis]QWG00311.1 caspase family protein [Flammeovirga yaeyamensis]